MKFKFRDRIFIFGLYILTFKFEEVCASCCTRGLSGQQSTLKRKKKKGEKKKSRIIQFKIVEALKCARAHAKAHDPILPDLTDRARHLAQTTAGYDLDAMPDLKDSRGRVH